MSDLKVRELGRRFKQTGRAEDEATWFLERIRVGELPRSTLRLAADPAGRVTWPGGGGLRPVEIRINGAPLLELVREVEWPLAEAECARRLREAGDDGEVPEPSDLAGDYLYLSGGETFLPSRNLLGAPYQHGFVLDPDDPRGTKSILLQCTCGITDFWFLLAKIVVSNELVIWRDFCQFHRDWDYSTLGPFCFDRLEYEAELKRPHS